MTRTWYVWLTGMGLALLASATVLLGVSVNKALSQRQEPGVVDFGQSDATTSTGFVLEPVVVQAPTPTPPPSLEPPASQAPVVRMAVPRIGIDAPVVLLGVDPNGVMQSPKGPEEVGIYDFSSQPGYGGNSVFSGHVDYHDYGPAVFWDLSTVEPGDIVEVFLEDGTVYRYAVVSASTYTAEDAPVEEIVGSTPVESVTLITCGGTFDYTVRQYSHRVVVRAERV